MRWYKFKAQFGRKRLWQVLLMVVLVFGLVMGVALPNGGQSPTPSVDDQVTQQAKEDVEMGTPQKRKEFREAFAKDANKKSRSSEELDRLYTKYVEAYNKAKDAKEADPNEAAKQPLQYTLPWIISTFALAIIALFKDWITSLVKQLSTTINTWIYKRFSGSKLFWNVALKKYRRALLEKHSQVKIPFRPNRPLEMTEVYVPLKVAGSRIEEKVEALQAVQNHRRLMVKGQPGSGKTMLLRYFALSYGNEKLRLADDPVVILLELHRLSGGAEILAELVEALKRDDFPNGMAFLHQALGKGRVVLLLDGLDEVNSIDRTAVVKRIKDFLDLYEKCGVVITCRSQVYQGEFDSVVNQTLEVVEFTDAQIQQFLRPWKAEMPAEKSVDQLVRALNDRPRIKELARNPLLLTIIAYLYADTPFVLPHSRAEFYRESTRWLLELWDGSKQTPNRYKGFTKGLVLQRLALFAQDSVRSRGQDRKNLGFQEVMVQVKALLPGLNLDEDEDLQPLVDEIVERSGLLLRVDGGAQYQFSHLTLQEYFAAAELVDKPQEITQRFAADSDAWREVVKLWCGLASDSTEVIQQICQIQPLIGFECLANSQNVDAGLADEIISSFQKQLTQARPNDNLEKAFASVAADIRPRGQKVFQFLVGFLNHPELNSVKIFAMHSLSLTNLPQAAAVLAQNYQDNPAIRQSLVRMGDLAVPHLIQLIQPHQEIVINDLARIGTPDAVKALIPSLWHSDIRISGRVSWRLAAFLSQQEIEEAFIQDTDLFLPDNPGDYYDWVWQPFTSVRNNRLKILIGRIAYLLNQTPTELISQPPPMLDPRIAIPVCAIAASPKIKIPTQWSPDFDSLLLAETLDEKANQVILKAIDRILGAMDSRSNWRVKLLATLPPRLQLEVLHRLINADRAPTSQDWLNVFQRVQFDFSQSWQYRSILSIALIISISAIIESLYLPLKITQSWQSWLFSLPIIVIINAWIFIWRGISQGTYKSIKLSPSLFLKFGVLGWLKFWREFKLLRQKKIVWFGSEIFCEVVKNVNTILISSGVTFFIALIVSSIFSVYFSVSATFKYAYTSAATLTIVFASAFASAFAGTAGTSNALISASIGSVAFIIAGAGTDAFAVSHAFAVAFAFAGVFASMSTGISFWYKTRKNSRSTILAVLSYPFFCATPLALIYSAFSLHNFFRWPIVIAIWLTIIALCTGLWQWGQWLERKARNPLQGILPEQYRPQ